MALTTDFDILVSHKDKDQGRKEKRPLFFTIIHSIPKQISDTAQSIGINEKTRKNGLMSGVILPSQVAHDRWLSTYDAIFDATFIFLVFLAISCFPLNLISLIAFSSIAVYMFFHILWWENSIQWDFIETIIDYIKKTRKYYYATFLVVYFSLSSFGYFFAYKYDIKSYLLKPIEYYEKATSYIKKTDLHDKIKLKKEKNEIVDGVVSNRFSSEATLKKEQIYKEKNQETDNIFLTRFDIERINLILSDEDKIDKIKYLELKEKYSKQYNLSDKEVEYFVFKGKIKNEAYSKSSEPIRILKKDKTIETVVEASDQMHLKALSKTVTKYFICYPKVID